MKELEKNQMNIVVRIILWFIMMCVATLPTTVVMLAGLIEGFAGVLVGALILLAMLALAAFIAAKNDIWTTNGRSFMGKAMKLGPSIGLAIGGGLFLRVWVVVLNMIIPIHTANDQALQGLASSQISNILLFFSMVVMAPVLEELVFRGFFFKFFFRENRLFAYLLSSLLFTLIHMPTDVISFVTYGSLALVMGFVYYKTNRIEMSMLTHAINNLLPALVLAFFS